MNLCMVVMTLALMPAVGVEGVNNDIIREAQENAGSEGGNGDECGKSFRCRVL